MVVHLVIGVAGLQNEAALLPQKSLDCLLMSLGQHRESAFVLNENIGMQLK
jgi:hypothetical protein